MHDLLFVLQASAYLNKLPAKLAADDLFVVADPMLATGGTIVQVVCAWACGADACTRNMQQRTVRSCATCGACHALPHRKHHHPKWHRRQPVLPPPLRRAKRKRAAEEKNTKMRSPNFLVSRNRLNVRNIPLGMSEGQLRSMFVAAVRERATKEVPRVLSVRPGVVG